MARKKSRSGFPFGTLLLIALLCGGAAFAWFWFRYPIRGIDVSHYQGSIRWKECADGGVRFAFIKATEGLSLVDETFDANWEEAGKAGIVRGAYHYFIPTVSAAQQARHFLKTINFRRGDLPPVLDIEQTNGRSARAITDSALVWLRAVEKSTGVKPIVYTMTGFAGHHLDARLATYPLWIASLNPIMARMPAHWTDWLFWQYTHHGKVAGIDGEVDKNYFNGSEKEFEKLRKR